MFEVPLKLAVLAFAGWVAWRVLTPRATFVIQLVDGVPQMKAGKVTAAQLAELGSLCHEAGVTRGHVSGFAGAKGRTVLKFSGEFSPGLQQQIRNYWMAVR